MKEEPNNLSGNNEGHTDSFQNKDSPNPFNENDKITLNDTNPAGVLNNPVPITSSSELPPNMVDSNEIPSSFSKFKIILSPIIKLFLNIGKYFQNLLSKLSDKVQVQSSYKYFLLFLALSLVMFFFALFYIPFIIFSPGKLLRLLSFGNIFLMASFFFYYGSKDFFAFLIDQNRTGIMFGHLLGVFSGLFVSLFIGGYFLQLLLDVTLCITTVMFFLTLIPGGQGGIKAIKGMLLSPLFLMYGTIKGKIFADNSGLPQ
jgi:hypothetical protein